MLKRCQICFWISIVFYFFHHFAHNNFLLRRETWSSGYDGKKKENVKITTPGMCIPLVHAYIIWTANFRTHHSHIAVFVCTPTLFPCDWYLLTQRGTQTQAHKDFKLSIRVCFSWYPCHLFICCCAFVLRCWKKKLHRLWKSFKKSWKIIGDSASKLERLERISVARMYVNKKSPRSTTEQLIRLPQRTKRFRCNCRSWRRRRWKPNRSWPSSSTPPTLRFRSSDNLICCNARSKHCATVNTAQQPQPQQTTHQPHRRTNCTVLSTPDSSHHRTSSRSLSESESMVKIVLTMFFCLAFGGQLFALAIKASLRWLIG